MSQGFGSFSGCLWPKDYHILDILGVCRANGADKHIDRVFMGFRVFEFAHPMTSVVTILIPIALPSVRQEPTLATHIAFFHFCSKWDTHLRVVCIFEAETRGRGLWRHVPAKALTWLMLG